jgi:hypothetical protein
MRIFTPNKIALFENIFWVGLQTATWIKAQPFAFPGFSRYTIGNSYWRYSIGQYYDKSGILQGNTINADLVQTPVYIGGIQDGNYFVPSEYSLTLRDTSLVYKRFAYFTTPQSMYLTDYQPVYKYINGAWTLVTIGDPIQTESVIQAILNDSRLNALITQIVQEQSTV